jgi:inner membrane protein
MCTVVTHAAVGLGIGRWFVPEERRPAFWWCAALLPVVPDLDVIGFALGVRYGDPLGHRGATHSILFAAAAGAAAGSWLGRTGAERARLALLLFLATASHGLLDMLTDGGYGVALWWPFGDERLFWPARPLPVPPIGVGGMFGPRGAAIVLAELLWIGLPLGLLLAAREAFRRRAPAPS